MVISGFMFQFSPELIGDVHLREIRYYLISKTVRRLCSDNVWCLYVDRVVTRSFSIVMLYIILIIILDA